MTASLRPSSLLPLIVLLSTGFWLGGCKEKTAAAGRGRASGPAPVLVAKAQQRAVPLTLDAIGSVEPIRSSTVRSQVTGTLVKILFKEGQDVKQGDILFEIDSRPFQNALRSAAADRQKIEVQLENARAQVARYRTLNTEALISKEQFQTILDNERALDAQVLAAEADLENAKLQVEYSTIRAPLSGRTGNLGVHEGDLVRASDANAILITINQISPIYVTFGVPQQHLATIIHYRAAAPIAVKVVPPGTDETVEKGDLTFVDNVIDSTTGTIKLKATFPNDKHRLWPGQFATVLVTLDAPTKLVVPASAVQTNQTGQNVFVVKADQTAEFRAVAIERTYEGFAVVTQGVKEGETVVIDGQLRVIAGRPVEVKQPGAPHGSGDKKDKGKGGKKGAEKVAS